MDEGMKLHNGAVRVTCSRCGEQVSRDVPLGHSIRLSYDQLLVWMNTQHRCRTADDLGMKP